MNIEESIEILESYKESLEEYEDNPRIIQAIGTLLTAYEKEKEKNKKVIKYCREKSTFQTFGDFELQNVLETYINRLKYRILDILEE